MAKINNINLKFNCPEKLENKHFCRKCCHTIIDFTSKTKKELRIEIKNSNGPVCGIFKKTQLSEQFLKYAAASLIATSLSVPSMGQEVIKTDSIVKTSEEEVNEEEEFFLGTIVEVCAAPIGGYEKFLQTITNKINYPPELKEGGKAFVEFAIDTLGRIKDVKLLRGFNPQLDQELIRVISTLNYPFTPGRQRGKAVNMNIVVPIIFNPKNGE